MVNSIEYSDISDLVKSNEIEAFTTPIKCSVEEDIYDLHNFADYEHLKAIIESALAERKLEFSPQLFRKNVLSNEKYRKKLNEVYSKYCSES